MDSYHEITTQFSAILEIFVHHATNIHNICIYENQDVYAKFSLTYNPDHTFSTNIINGGGKNPQFNQKLLIKINHFDALLKCEIWMLSRAKSLMEDQLLGFCLVPISLVVEKGQSLTQDFSLSSTDLFHSPAGTVKLTLSLNTNSSPINLNVNSSSITSEVVLLHHPNVSQIDPSRIEFPDINVVCQNQQMVSQYFGLSQHASSSSNSKPPFLCLGASDVDYEMVPNSGLFSSTMGDDRKSDDSLEESDKKEESAMQRQIVDMYMTSMQQFTESLAKMKLPMNLEQIEEDDHVMNNKNKNMKKKDGGRVFYGSRAFF